MTYVQPKQLAEKPATSAWGHKYRMPMKIERCVIAIACKPPVVAVRDTVQYSAASVMQNKLRKAKPHEHSHAN